MSEKSVKTRSRKKEQQSASQAELPLESQRENEEKVNNYRFLFLTNRNNLLDILSSGWIRPATKYKKYYDDPGSLCPEAIPLLAVDPSSDFVRDLLPSDPDIFPVLLDLDLQDMSGEIQIILNTYRVEQGTLPLRDEAVSIVVQGIIPASCIRCIYFRSAAEREEHKSMRYENVRPGDYPLYVASERFQGASLDIDLLRQAFHQTRQQVVKPDLDLFSGVESLGGALVLLGSFATRASQLSLQVLQSTLMTLWHYNPGQNIAPETNRVQTGLAQYLDLLPSLLLNEVEHAQIVEAEIRNPPDGIVQYISQSHFPADLLLFCLMVKVLANTGVGDYLNEEVLQSVKKDWERLSPGIVSEEAQGIYIKLLASIQAVLRNRMDLADFPEAQSLAATSLLLFFLRSRPEQTLSWIKEEPCPASDALALAVTLSGILFGRSLLPVGGRTDGKFEEYVDKLLIWKLNTLHHGILASTLPEQPAIEIAGNVEILKFSEQASIQRTVQTSPTNTVREVQVPPQATELQGQRPESEDSALIRLLEADLNDERVKAAVIYLCEVLNWEECITTVISLERRRFLLNQKPELRVSGFISTPFEIAIHLDRFRRRMANETWHSLSDTVKEQVKVRLEGSI